MAQFYTLLTQTGQAKMANAIALGQLIEITHLAVGDGGGSMPTPDSNRTTLVNEVRRAQINRVAVDEENPSWLIVEQVLPPDVGGWTIREVGIFDADGDLIGYGNYPATYKPTLDEGSGRTQTIRMVLEVSHTSNITLRVDPSVVLATRKYADDAIAGHAGSRNHPAGTTTAQGMLQLATSEEARGGTRTDRAVHPAGLKSHVDQRAAGQQQVDAGEEDNIFVTPKALKQWNKPATEDISGLVKLATALAAQQMEDEEAVLTPKTLAEAFKGGNQSVGGGSGYYRLPGGLVLQWGLIGSGSSGTTSFPIEFPNECLHVFTTEDNGSGNHHHHPTYNLATNQFQWRCGNNQGVNSAGGSGARFFAIGY
ncbi:phage tail protein [Spirulina subsalsa FACHB-351]|uniref:Phage tail protein n=1 Tax=Spirulina subsalsa FACHB-351 TaxID=234711 RepID=A0ABT3L5N5_9CYAN|nr:phage tail protein [Spirulina subsalsa]MCW6036826.1 phage tail protein [Spirulina subsalsa FACHB-351]